MQLTDTETALLDFKRHWWKYPGAKEQAIHDTFAWSPTRHYQGLSRLLDRPEALAYDPMPVRRLPGFETHAEPCGEALLLCYIRHIPRADSDLRNG